jgi:two-component system, NtrC family, sensor kinase
MFKKIGIKLIIAVVAIVTIIFGVYFYLNTYHYNKVLYDQVERNSLELSETIKSSGRYAMLLNQIEPMHYMINSIGSQENIHSVRIYNKEGVIMYSSNQPDIGTQVDMSAESCYHCHAENQALERLPTEKRTRVFQIHPDSSRLMGVITPIYNEPSCWVADCHAHPRETTVLGVLDVTTSLDHIEEEVKQSNLENTFIASAAIILLILIIGAIVRILVIKPVNILVKATQEVAGGNLSYVIQSKNDDELGVLAHSFNNMTAKLSEARLQLFQSDKLASLGKLAAGVAHEINNPLTGVLTYSSFLLKRAKDNPEMHQSLEIIVRETERCREIVKGLLDFSRQSQPKKLPASINDVIDRSISVVENQLILNHVKLIKNYDITLQSITVDSNQMQQVMINLIVNASDAIGPKGGSISIMTGLLRFSPFGRVQVKKAYCPKGHNLIDSSVKIEGQPSIKVKVISNNKEGYVHLDPVYGKYRHALGIDIEDQQLVQFQCPYCSHSLIEHKSCPKCSAPIYTLEVPGKGNFEGCSRKDCSWQKWDAVDEEGYQDFVEIKITDTGSGISKANLEKIFDPFFSTKGQKGTGLGLAVIWGIIDNHNGKITVDSEVGVGTTFTIQIPYQQ